MSPHVNMWHETQSFQLLSTFALLRFFMNFPTKGMMQKTELAVSKLD